MVDSDGDHHVAGVAMQPEPAVPNSVVDVHNQTLSRQKRQYYYWNAIYSPYEYHKKKKYPPNRRGFKSTTQRYTIWDLS